MHYYFRPVCLSDNNNIMNIFYFCTDSTRTTRLLASSSPMLYTKPALKRVPGIAGQCMTQLNDLAVPWTQTKNLVCLWCVRFAQGIILEDWYGDGSTTRYRLLMGLFSSRQMKSVGCLYLLWIFVEYYQNVHLV